MSLEGFEVDPITKAVVRASGTTSPLKILSRKIKVLEQRVADLEEKIKQMEGGIE